MPPLTGWLDQPPDGAFLHRPFHFEIAEQERGSLAERGLMPDDQHGDSARPASAPPLARLRRERPARSHRRSRSRARAPPPSAAYARPATPGSGSPRAGVRRASAPCAGRRVHRAAVSLRARSGSPGSASQWRHRMRSMPMTVARQPSARQSSPDASVATAAAAAPRNFASNACCAQKGASPAAVAFDHRASASRIQAFWLSRR